MRRRVSPAVAMQDITNNACVAKYFRKGPGTPPKSVGKVYKPQAVKFTAEKLRAMSDGELEIAELEEHRRFTAAYDHQALEDFPLTNTKLVAREKLRRRQWPYGK